MQYPGPERHWHGRPGPLTGRLELGGGRFTGSDAAIASLAQAVDHSLSDESRLYLTAQVRPVPTCQ